MANAASVMIDATTGQLGTVLSSRRYKKDIHDIDADSRALMDLRPVAFKYRQDLDPTGSEQYGLVAEEVAKVRPDLVIYKDGKPETVRYHFINAMLLNEVQRQEKLVEQQQKVIDALEKRLERLEKRTPK